MEIKQTAKIGDTSSCTLRNTTEEISNNGADSSLYSENSTEAGLYNQENGLVSELKKFILDDEASSDSSIGVDQDELSVQENVCRIQRQLNEFGEAINEDYRQYKDGLQNIKADEHHFNFEEGQNTGLSPSFRNMVFELNIDHRFTMENPLSATVPQVEPVQEPLNFKARLNSMRPEHCLCFGLFLYAIDIFLWVFYFGLRPIAVGLSIAFVTNIAFLFAVLGFLCTSSKILFATISVSVLKMVGFLSLLIILLALEIDNDLIKEDDFIIGNLVEKPKYVLYPLLLTCKVFISFHSMQLYYAELFTSFLSLVT